MAPVASTHNRPRLKAIASSKGSLASSMLPGGSCRSLLVVAIRIRCAGAAPDRENVIRRVARVQRITSCTPRESENIASLASGALRQLHTPAVVARVRQSAGGG